MKISKRIFALLFSIITALTILPVQIFAAGSIDLEKNVTITISYQDNKTALAGAKFDLYLVATLDAYGELTPTETFAQFNVNIRGENDEAWRTLASTLEGYVLRDSVTPTDSGKTDQQGILLFPTGQKKLEHGLYLIIGQRHSQNGYIYETEPFMVLLPGLDKENNDWNYEVTASPKHESRPEPKDDTVTRKVLKVWKDSGYEKNRPKEVIIQLLRDGTVYDTVTLNADNNWRYTWSGLEDKYRWVVVEKELKDYTVKVTQEGVTFVVTNTYSKENPGKNPPTSTSSTNTEKPGNSKLPQTGQLWWPVPVLITSGLFLIIIGLLRRRGNEYEK